MTGPAPSDSGGRPRALGGFARGLFVAVLAVFAGLPAGAAEGPQRVVSLNVCTDQLAMMLAAPGQLVAVSALARDPRASVMAEQAAAYPVTHGGAEEVFQLQPDLVLAGTYTTRHTTTMLRRLGVEVVEFAPTDSLQGIREDISRMGRVLGREAAAEALLAEFDARLAALRDDPPHRPRAALWSANGWSAGPRTLSGDILDAAGFDNVAAEAGLQWGGTLPLERLIMLDPDIVITGEPYPGHSRSEALLVHPALAALREARAGAALSDAHWVCGTPHVLQAVARLRAAREALP
jgi:iron complex transport system substrate-binding protein